jgi:glucose/arabinose dehydrogenase
MVLHVARPARTLIALASLIAVILAAGVAPAGGATIGAGPSVRAATIEERPVATGLDYPAAFTFADDGRIFYGERFSGEVRIINRSTGTNHLFFDVSNLSTDGEQGLLGVALHPNFPKTPYVYVYATRTVGGLHDQILRITNSGGHGTNMKVIFSSSTTAGQYHDGGRILFGPDGMLYAIQGEAHSPSNAQNLQNPAGKVLRMTPAGQPAPGNPFGNRIFSYGLRNSFGFAFDPRTGRLWETENGPSCNDELNRIVKGGNFGWGPNETCSGQAPQNTNQDGPKPRILPKRFYTPTIAPVGVAFCKGCGLGSQSEGKLFFLAYKTHQIWRVRLSSNRLGVRSQTVVHSHGNSVFSMEVSPGGGLFFSAPSGIFKLVQT